MEGLQINPEDLRKFLIDNDCLIVSRKDYEAKIDFKHAELKKLQRVYLSKKMLTFKQILDAKLLKLTTKQSIQNWVDTGIFQPGEMIRDGNTKYILTSAIKRVNPVL